MQPPHFLCQGIYNGLYDKLLHFAFFKHGEHFNVKKRVAECVVIDHQVESSEAVENLPFHSLSCPQIINS